MPVTSSYSWAQLVELTRQLGVKRVNLGNNDVLLAQMVSSQIYTFYPWQFSLTDTIPGQIPCINGIQDYPRPQDCYRLVRGWLTVTAPASVPQDDRDLDVCKTLNVNMFPQAYTSIRSIAEFRSTGLWRLETAINVPTNFPIEIRAQYQPIVATLQDLSTPAWFPDEYINMAMDGLLYWLYKFAEDDRAGTMTYTNGTKIYTGQLGIFMGKMEAAAADEQAGAVSTVFPTESLTSRMNYGPIGIGI